MAFFRRELKDEVKVLQQTCNPDTSSNVELNIS
jgi:hypothetical protein